MKMRALWPTETTVHQLALSPYLHCSITPATSSPGRTICTSGGYPQHGLCRSYSWNVSVIHGITVSAADKNWIC